MDDVNNSLDQFQRIEEATKEYGSSATNALENIRDSVARPLNEAPLEDVKKAGGFEEDKADLKPNLQGSSERLAELAQLEQLDEQQPLLFVDINLGGSEQERIVVYDGDTAADLAAGFCLEHNLDEETQQKLKELLEVQMAGVLHKIDEGESDEDD